MLGWFCASCLGDFKGVTVAIALMLVSTLLVGLLAGYVGIGGVLLPLALVYVSGLDLHLHER
jgi:uncharacterized membrane protein YfcA